MKTSLSFLSLLTLTFIIILSSCSKDNNNDDFNPSELKLKTNEFIHQVMIEEAWYYWHDQVEDIAPDNETEPAEYLQSLLNKDIDRWSFIIDIETYRNMFEKGVYYGLGFSYDFHTDNSLRVRFVYKNSPMDRAGVKRGDKILKINGKTPTEISEQKLWNSIMGSNAQGVSVRFDIEHANGSMDNINVQKEEVTQNTVLFSNTYELDSGEKVGYLVFQTFIEPSINQLAEAFSNFKNEGVTKLIVDLRYNTGGQMNVADYLADLIAGTAHNGKLFTQIKYNDLHDDEGNTFNLNPVNYSLDNVDQLVFLASRSTASASEVIINGLKPYIETVQIGDDTHGKPVGMNGFVYLEQVLFPITFKIINSDGSADYFDGIPANAYVHDGLDKDFGDMEEAGFKEAMHYLNTGNFSNITKKGKKTGYLIPEPTGFQALTGAY